MSSGIQLALVYPATDTETPSLQFCYAEVGNLSAATDVTVNLATKENGQVRGQAITDAKIIKAPVTASPNPPPLH